MTRKSKSIIEQVAAAMSTRGEPIREPKRIDVTPERGRRNKFVSAGMARKVVPVIETLLIAQRITATEYDALLYYGNQASQAEDDEAEMNVLCPEKIMGGTQHAMPVGGFIPAKLIATPAILETARIERDLGTLRDIARAIAVDNKSLSQWCIEKHGGRERYDGKGKFIAVVPINENYVMDLARLELRMAARRIIR